MFIRKKKINNKHYGYLVENVWTKQGSRQKVKAYLGKIHNLESEKDHEFRSNTTEPKALTKQLILWELEKHGFKQYPDNENQVIKDFVVFNKNTAEIKERNKNVVLKLNEGYLCSHTIQLLFKELQRGRIDEEDDPRQRATQLAEAFTNAGIKIPQEAFIDLFQRVAMKSD